MYRVLVVDDSSLIQTIYRQSLRKLKDDLEVHFASNGVQALAALQRGVTFELMFLDINMPEMDGLELLSELSARGYLVSTAVVIVSTESSAADVERGLRAGAAHYLKKPFQQQDLWSIVSRYLGIGRPEPEPRAAQGRERGS
jgi:CheY-like chemotaxis protein